MSRPLRIVIAFLVIVVLPCLVYWPGTGNLVPNEPKFRAYVPDPVAQEGVARVLQEERLAFERSLSDSGNLNYASVNERLLEEQTFPLVDSTGETYALSRAHIAFLRRAIFGSHYGDGTKTITAIRNMKPAQGDFNPHWFLYGGSYIYPAAALLKVADLVGYLRVGDVRFFILNPVYLQRIFLVVQFLNLIAFIAGTWLIARIARKVSGGDWVAGILAAVFFATTPLYVAFVHVCKPYTVALTYSLAAFWFFLLWLESRKRRLFVAAAAAWGLAVGANYFSVVHGLGLLVLYLHEDRFDVRAPAAWRRALGLAAGFSALGALAFFASNPYWIISWREVYHEIFVLTDPPAKTWSTAMNYLYIFIRPFYTIGIPATILSYVFVAKGLAGKSGMARAAVITFLLFGLGTTLIWNMKPAALVDPLSTEHGHSEHYEGYNSHPLLVLILVEGLRRLGFARPLTIGLTVLTLGYNLVYSGHTLRHLATFEKVHHEAGDWIEANVPPGDPILPAVLLDDPRPEARKLLQPQYPMPYFDILRHPLVYPVPPLDAIDSWPRVVIARTEFLDAQPAFTSRYRKVYSAGGLGRWERRFFYRQSFDWDPIYIYFREP